MKRIVFIDGDGTLWYPSKTKYNDVPWWVYENPQTKGNPLTHLTLIPNVKVELRKLRSSGMILVLLSTQPGNTKAERLESLMRKVRHFRLERYFDEFRAARRGPRPKGRFTPDRKDLEMLDVLKRRGIPKSQALMVGDSYANDYLPARGAGVDALLVNNFRHIEGSKWYNRVRRKERYLGSVLKYVK